MEGADIYQIAKNCRTSVEMIEKYYASHIKTSLDAAAINVRRARPWSEIRDNEQLCLGASRLEVYREGATRAWRNGRRNGLKRN